jgi:hypothetical protein
LVELTAYAECAPAKAAAAHAAFETIAANVASFADGTGVITRMPVAAIVIIAVWPEGIIPQQGAAGRTVHAGVRGRRIAPDVGRCIIAPIPLLAWLMAAGKGGGYQYQFYVFCFLHPDVI